VTVFVSYSSRDKDAVKNLTQDLQDAEEQVWMDQRLAGGEAWWRAILEQIRGCDVFIFALSQNSIQSKPCQAELHYAQALGVPILPVQVGSVDSMQLNPLATVQTVDYRTPTPSTAMRLISAINRTRAQRQPLPTPLPDEPEVPFEYLIRLYTTVAGPDQLSPRDQAALVAQLQVGLREDGDHDAARNDIVTLLTKLRDREDVTFRTRTDVEAILASIDSPPAAPPPSVMSPALPTSAPERTHLDDRGPITPTAAAQQRPAELKLTATQHRPPDRPPVPPARSDDRPLLQQWSRRTKVILVAGAVVLAAGIAASIAIAVITQHSSSGEESLQSKAPPGESFGQSGDLGFQIVGQVEIDQNGAEVKPEAGATPVGPAGEGTATCPPVSIAVAGPLSGPNAVLGINIGDGARLAVDKHNAANPGCQVQLKTFETEGDSQKAAALAPQIIDDASTIGLVGPAFSGETMATGSVFDQAGLVAATPSASNVTLSAQGWKTFFRGLANDGVQGPAVANYMKNSLGDKKVCVVDNGTNYGVGLAQGVRETLGPVADSACKISVPQGNKDFSDPVSQIKGQSPDSVFYSGYWAEAAAFVQQLRDGGFTGKFVSGDGSKDPALVNQAGQASKDTILSCPCGPATGSFADEYTKTFGQAPGAFSPEGYDLATILLTGIDSGAITRPALLDYVRKYNGQGVARKYQWAQDGELTTPLIWIYKVQ
jgi:branched-chain amino acid transport system substrate-binding protein